MLILGLDPSLSGTGIALIDFKDGKSKIQAIETVKTKNTGALRLIDIKKKISSYLEDPMIQAISKENYAFAAQGRATFSLGELGGIISVLACEKGFVQGKNFHVIHCTSWRKFLLGKGNLKKDTSYLMTMQKAFGISFLDDNQSDAYCLAVMGGYIHSIRNGLMKFSDLTENQQICLLDLKKLQERNLTQITGLKKLSDEEKKNYMLDF